MIPSFALDPPTPALPTVARPQPGLMLASSPGDELRRRAECLRRQIAVLEAAMLALDVPLVLRDVVADMYTAVEELALRLQTIAW